MDKTKIINILQKNEMNVYEVGQLFEYVSKYFKEFERSLVMNAKYAIEDTESLIAKGKEMLNSVDTWIARVDEKSQETFKESERIMSDIYAQHEKFREKMAELPVFEKDFHVPYDLEKLLKIAKECENLSDNAWQRVIDLAKTLKEA